MPELRFETQRLTSFAGLVAIQALLARIDLKKRLARCFEHVTNGAIYGRSVVFLQLVIHLMLGYRDLRDSVHYRDDPMIKRLLGLGRLPDTSTISRIMKETDECSIRRLRSLLRKDVLNNLKSLGLPRVTLDFDGSVQSTTRHADPAIDTGVAGDWDGDGLDDPARFRASTGDWHFTTRVGKGVLVAPSVSGFGTGKTPVAGSWASIRAVDAN